MGKASNGSEGLPREPPGAEYWEGDAEQSLEGRQNRVSEHLGNYKREPQGSEETKVVAAEFQGRPKESLEAAESASKACIGRQQGPNLKQKGAQKCHV